MHLDLTLLIHVYLYLYEYCMDICLSIHLPMYVCMYHIYQLCLFLEGVLAVYRIAFTDFIFFVFLSLCTKLVDPIRAHIQFWFLKLLLWIGLCTAMFYVDDNTFTEVSIMDM